MKNLKKSSLFGCLLILAGCQNQMVQDPYVINGNTITYQHKSDISAINKANSDAKSQCLSLGYKTALVAHTSCSAGDCVTKFTCEQ